MNAVIFGIFVLFSVALVGWLLAEVKAKNCQYKANDEEKESECQTNARLLDGGWKEMTIKDVIKTISTKGFSAN
ncbi:MAG: hypothetical protein IKX24_07255 [Prevotella sp.]|nr:hypothetical protein [Prevotella sp.]